VESISTTAKTMNLRDVVYVSYRSPCSYLIIYSTISSDEEEEVGTRLAPIFTSALAILP
jgi:hypothetical protein